MIILSHRGYWIDPSEKNTVTAFERSFEAGFGTETDIRDYRGELVISHDIADGNCIPVGVFFDIYNRYDCTLPLALNIKADGLQGKLKELIEAFGITNYFLFDMSLPDHLVSNNYGLKTFTRQSEYEPDCLLYDTSEGVWLDEFHTHWINGDIIGRHINAGKRACIVSPDLHKRGYDAEWANYKQIDSQLKNSDCIMLCTDYPTIAREYFNEN